MEETNTRNKYFEYNVTKCDNKTEQKVLRKHKISAPKSAQELREGFLKECRLHTLFNFTVSVTSIVLGT